VLRNEDFSFARTVILELRSFILRSNPLKPLSKGSLMIQETKRTVYIKKFLLSGLINQMILTRSTQFYC
jgi:hypothetical protein